MVEVKEALATTDNGGAIEVRDCGSGSRPVPAFNQYLSDDAEWDSQRAEQASRPRCPVATAA